MKRFSPQKFGTTLCSAQIMRASSVVMNGFLLTCRRTEDPELSLRISGEAPCSSASFGTRYKSPDPCSTYAPGSGISCQETSISRFLCCGSIDTFAVCVAMRVSFLTCLVKERTPTPECPSNPGSQPGFQYRCSLLRFKAKHGVAGLGMVLLELRAREKTSGHRGADARLQVTRVQGHRGHAESDRRLRHACREGRRRHAAFADRAHGGGGPAQPRAHPAHGRPGRGLVRAGRHRRGYVDLRRVAGVGTRSGVLLCAHHSG